jgi:hypothetical protein
VVETSNNFGNEKNVVQNINDRSAQAKALAEARGHVYKDLLLRNFTDTQIIEAFGELSVSDEDVAVPGAVAAPVPAPGVAVPPAAAPPAAAPPAAAPEIESPTAQARRILQEQRPDLNYSVLRAQGYTDQQMIDAFRPGPTVAAAERAGADKLKVDYNALLRTVRRGSAGEEDIARYAAETMAGVTGKTYEDYKSEGLSNNQISELLFDEESVARKANPVLRPRGKVDRSRCPLWPPAPLTGGSSLAATFRASWHRVGWRHGRGHGWGTAGPRDRTCRKEFLGRMCLCRWTSSPLIGRGALLAKRFLLSFAPYVAMARTPLAHLSLLKHRQQQGVSTTPFDSLRLAAAFRPKSLAATEASRNGFWGIRRSQDARKIFSRGTGHHCPRPGRGRSPAPLRRLEPITAASTNLIGWGFFERFKTLQVYRRSACNEYSWRTLLCGMYDSLGPRPVGHHSARLKETPLADLAQTYGVDIGHSFHAHSSREMTRLCGTCLLLCKTFPLLWGPHVPARSKQRC